MIVHDSAKQYIKVQNNKRNYRFSIWLRAGQYVGVYTALVQYLSNTEIQNPNSTTEHQDYRSVAIKSQI